MVILLFFPSTKRYSIEVFIEHNLSIVCVWMHALVRARSRKM